MKIKDSLSGNDYVDIPESERAEYIEVSSEPQKKSSKINIRPFILETFEDVKPILDALREGYTISLINIRPLKDKDLVELKRAINKLKKTCEAIDGDIAGFGEDWIAVTPSFASIHRPQPPAPQQGQQRSSYGSNHNFETY
jgi:SepF-like predicted cell division protein (DUF552 family)